MLPPPQGIGGAPYAEGKSVAFTTPSFVWFFLLVALVHFALPQRARWIWLLAASLFFYGYAEPSFLIQILAATAVSFWLAQKIEAAPDKASKQKLLWPGIALLAGNLVLFKYTPMFNETLRGLLGLAHVDYPIPELRWLLPLGISFYTFQLISYLVDVFRGQKAEGHFGLFALYVTFFPKLVAGPIERAKNLLPQLHARPGFSYAQSLEAMQLIIWGVIQKAVIADRIAPFVNTVYDNPAGANGVQITLATFLYAFQIYADFAGYTNIALGIALLFGYRLTQNFARPYFAVSVQDFWKRWHISLSSWLTDYIYTPLTRQKTIKIKFYTLMLWSLLITFVISGFWHGANWNFVAWGALHGGYIVIALLLQKRWNTFARQIKLTERPRLYRGLKIGVTFLLICFAYILFRANDMADALLMISHLGTGWNELTDNIKSVIGGNLAQFLLAAIGIAVLMGADLLHGRIKTDEAFAPGRIAGWVACYAAIVCIILFGAFYDDQQQFIYFRF